MPNLHSSKWHLSAAAASPNLFTAANGGELNKAEGRGKVATNYMKNTHAGAPLLAIELPSAENPTVAAN